MNNTKINKLSDEKKSKKQRNYHLPKKLNKNPETSKHIEKFQEAMVERILLNYAKKCTTKNINRIHNRIFNNYGKLSISDGIQTTAAFEPELYLNVQFLLKDMTGNFYAMDDFIHLLVSWFYQYYSDETNGKKLPFKKIKNKKIKTKKRLFESKFSKFYKNSF